MKKFDAILKKYGVLSEQDVAQPAQTDAAMPPAEVAAPATPEEPQTQPLTSEGEAMLVRLLKKALVITPDATDTDTINEMPEINPNNSRAVLDQLITLIRKYDPDIDFNK